MRGSTTSTTSPFLSQPFPPYFLATCRRAFTYPGPCNRGNSLLIASHNVGFETFPLYSSDGDSDFLDTEEEEDEAFMKKELARLESLEDIIGNIEIGDEFEDFLEEDVLAFENDTAFENDVDDIFLLLDDNPEFPEILDSAELEKALLQGVVPVSAGVGSECLPGDWGFDPLNFASKDYILKFQYNVLQALPGSEQVAPPVDRPTALILRDYREAEIRHGRLSMLAAVFWPLQEMLDRLLLDEDQFGPLVYDTVTLPYVPLIMTLVMMLLGYLDIFAKQIQERENIGDAFLPGDCFWDPLNVLEGAPPSMKRNMQERELFNGRVAMLAVAAYFFEEATSGVPVIEVEGNQLLFVPAYEIPYIQEWLDAQFAPSFYG